MKFDDFKKCVLDHRIKNEGTPSVAILSPNDYNELFDDVLTKGEWRDGIGDTILGVRILLSHRVLDLREKK